MVPTPMPTHSTCGLECIVRSSSPPSSSSQPRKEKRCNPFAGMSITRIGSEESDDDLDHEHICKRVSQDLSFSRNLLVAHKTNCAATGDRDNFDESMGLFAEFLKDMPLPEEYSDKFDDRLTLNSSCFNELDNFLNLPQSHREEDNFWRTMYIMQQESQ